jgi:hypothetical protein
MIGSRQHFIVSKFLLQGAKSLVQPTKFFAIIYPRLAGNQIKTGF